MFTLGRRNTAWGSIAFHKQHCLHLAEGPESGVVDLPTIGSCDRLPIELRDDPITESVRCDLARPEAVPIPPVPIQRSGTRTAPSGNRS